MYKTNYPTYLVHFNRNHDPKNGQFAEGDGDGDGIIDDHHYKKLDKMSNKKLYKTLKKEVRLKKKELHGWGEQWAWNTTTGKNSERVYKEKMALEKKYESSPEYKNWISKVNALNRKMEYTDDLDKIDQLEKEWDELMSKQPKKDFNSLFGPAIVDSGHKFSNDFIKGAGQEMSLAYLKDLGYSDKKAKEYVDRMAKEKYTLFY